MALLSYYDCGKMLEALSILLHRQGAQALRQFLAEGELTAVPSVCKKGKCRILRDSYILKPEL